MGRVSALELDKIILDEGILPTGPDIAGLLFGQPVAHHAKNVAQAGI